MGRRRGRRRAPFKLKLSSDLIQSIAAIFLIAAGGILFLSFTRQTFILRLIYQELTLYAGWVSFLAPFLFFAAGLMLTKLRWRITKPNVFVGGAVIITSLAVLTKSGLWGQQIRQNAAALITKPGVIIIFSGLILVGIIIITETPLDEFLLKIASGFQKTKSALGSFKSKTALPAWNQRNRPVKIKGIGELDSHEITANSSLANETQAVKTAAPNPSPLEQKVLTNLPGSASEIWKYPPVSLLKDSFGGKADRGDVKNNADIIEKTLDSFGIHARVVEFNGGPAITQYALEIALGTKLAKITTLQNDLARALASPTGQIRIEAPIPGRSLVGIEVPNHSPEFVTLRKVLTSKELKNNPSKLAVALGLNVSGHPIVADIDQMPHVLIAGATGSGKSVAINSFLCTILFRASPEEVKLILIDPKRVELTCYNGIPHLLTPVIVEPAMVVSALKWALGEMERRYKVFAEVGAKNIASYNEQSGFQAMPYILIVVDELADVIMFAPNEVEESITRLAQMARATGIHLIVATQRPSTDVITGLIKANIPCRIAFNVTSMVDSRVILDSPGAEKLLGRGDMLYIPPNQAKPTRIQGTFVSDAEINQLINYLRQIGVRPDYNLAVTEKYQPGKSAGGRTGATFDENGAEVDDLFDQAIRTIVQNHNASASFLQRRLSIGYARAARILDQLHHYQAVGAADGAKPRKILIKDAEAFLGELHSGS